MLGENWRENINRHRLAEFISDKEIKTLFNNVCAEINESMISDFELVNLIKITPYVIGISIIFNIKNRDTERLTFMLHDCYYNEFINDVKTVNKKGVSAFQRRFESIKLNNAQKFLDERLLSREELEILIRKVIQKSKLDDSSYAVTHETYNGDNKYLSLLVKAHLSLTNPRHGQINYQIMNKIKYIHLKNLLNNLKEYNKSVDL